MGMRLGVLLLCMVATQPARAETILVDDGFEGYPDTAAFLNVWVPSTGSGGGPANPEDHEAGILSSDASRYPGIQGNAVDHVGAMTSNPGMVNQFGGFGMPPFEIVPSADQPIVLKADLFVDISSTNARMTVGLRSRDPVAANILELGVFNGATCDPTVEGCTPGTATPLTPGYQPSLGYAYRLVLFAGFDGELLVMPNWQYFVLPQELDRDFDLDESVTVGDVGSGWHTYSAVIRPESITLSIDLFRDGLRNTSVTPDPTTGLRPGTPGVDAEVTWQVATDLTHGFDSLRIGGPSGLSGIGSSPLAFDNVSLVVPEPGMGAALAGGVGLLSLVGGRGARGPSERRSRTRRPVDKPD